MARRRQQEAGGASRWVSGGGAGVGDAGDDSDQIIVEAVSDFDDDDDDDDEDVCVVGASSDDDDPLGSSDDDDVGGQDYVTLAAEVVREIDQVPVDAFVDYRSSHIEQLYADMYKRSITAGCAAGELPGKLREMSERRSHESSSAKFDGFDVEFAYIEFNSDVALDKLSACLSHTSKNRYVSIVAPDDTLLHLLDDTAYINGNAVDAHGILDGCAPRRYAVTQGPLSSTVGDFWSMAFAQNARIVVMLCRVKENGRTKCTPYWEPERAHNSGFVLQILSTTNLGSYTLRRIRVTRTVGQREAREFAQFQYTEWPDFGVPAESAPFLDMLSHIETVEGVVPPGAPVPADRGPIIVHCSAGVGRSGTFCAVHAHRESFKAARNPTGAQVKLVSSVLQFRHQRPGMVQTKRQLQFAYQALHDFLYQQATKPRPAGVDSPTHTKAASKLKKKRGKKARGLAKQAGAASPLPENPDANIATCRTNWRCMADEIDEALVASVTAAAAACRATVIESIIALPLPANEDFAPFLDKHVSPNFPNGVTLRKVSSGAGQLTIGHLYCLHSSKSLPSVRQVLQAHGQCWPDLPPGSVHVRLGFPLPQRAPDLAALAGSRDEHYVEAVVYIVLGAVDEEVVARTASEQFDSLKSVTMTFSRAYGQALKLGKVKRIVNSALLLIRATDVSEADLLTVGDGIANIKSTLKIPSAVLVGCLASVS